VRLQFGFRTAILFVSTWVLLNRFVVHAFTGFVGLLSSYIYLGLGIKCDGGVRHYHVI
jgi:hypothetical protein